MVLSLYNIFSQIVYFVTNDKLKLKRDLSRKTPPFAHETLVTAGPAVLMRVCALPKKNMTSVKTRKRPIRCGARGFQASIAMYIYAYAYRRCISMTWPHVFAVNSNDTPMRLYDVKLTAVLFSRRKETSLLVFASQPTRQRRCRQGAALWATAPKRETTPEKQTKSESDGT